MPRRLGLAALPNPRLLVFAGLWVTSTLGLAWLVLQGRLGFDQPTSLPALLAGLVCALALIWCLPGPSVPQSSASARNRPGLLVATTLAIGVTLFGANALFGRSLLFGFPVVALVVLAALRPRLSRRDLPYAAVLALVAAGAGLGAGWISFVSPEAWAALQIPLVLGGLLAGWGILRRVGFEQAGIGRSLYLSKGARAAALGFLQGAALALPWALLNTALGAASGDSWVRAWWQPVVAIQPGIAEEAWSRVLLVALLFLPLRRFGRARLALAMAVVIAGYWVAYLHTPGGLGAIASTLLIGTIFNLPLSYLWLRRGLEVAVGFHFQIDFVRFAAAYVLGHLG